MVDFDDSWSEQTRPDAAAVARADEATLSLIDLLRFTHKRVSVAESCTGGLIAKRLTDFPGSSAWFCEGVVAYSNGAKTRLLAVDPAVIARDGAVSESVVRAMAEGARHLSGADVAAAVSGIAGPGGATPDKPVGTVAIAVAWKRGVKSTLHHFEGNRATVREAAAAAALTMLAEVLKS